MPLRSSNNPGSGIIFADHFHLGAMPSPVIKPRSPPESSKKNPEIKLGHWFMSLDGARSQLKEWQRDYNEEKPHSGIGQNVPVPLDNSGGASSPSLAREAEKSSLW